jgi:cell division protein FtsA
MAIETTAVLEIGTTTVRAIVGELRADGIVSVIGIGEAESRGIRKGEIINRDHAISSVRAAIKAAEENRRRSIHSILLVTSGGQAESKTSTGMLKLVDPEEKKSSRSRAKWRSRKTALNCTHSSNISRLTICST